MLWLGSLIGGLLAARSASRQATIERRRQDTSISRIVADARTAGVNPLAALGSTAAGSFSTPVLPTATAGDAIADAFGQYGAERSERRQQDVQSQQMEMAREAHEAQLGLLRAQRSALEMETAMGAARVRSEIAAARAAVIGGPVVGGALAPYAPSPLASTGFVVTHPGFAQEVENNYGEVPGNVAGLGALAMDAAANLPRPRAPNIGLGQLFADRPRNPPPPGEERPWSDYENW